MQRVYICKYNLHSQSECVVFLAAKQYMYTEMEDQHTRVFLSVLLVSLNFISITCRSNIFTKHNNDYHKYDLFIDDEKTENFKLDRFKRFAENSNTKSYGNVSNTELNGKLSSSTFFLPNLNHTQAVVSWSGKNSSVSILNS